MGELTLHTRARPQSPQITLRDAIVPVFRQRRLAVAIFLGVFLGAVLAGLLLPRKYEAEMKILVNRERIDPVVTPNPDAPVPAQPAAMISEEDLNSEVELLKSRDLLEQVAINCNLTSQSNTFWEHSVERLSDVIRGVAPAPETRLARAVQKLEDRLIIDPLRKTTLIRVSYKARDPQLAARVLQSLATLYEEKHAAVHRPAGTFTFFDQETARYRTELAAAESRLSEFNRREGIVSAIAQKQLVMEQLSQFEAELQQAHASAYEARRRANSLRSQAAGGPDRQTTVIKKQDNAQLLAQLEGTLLTLELHRTELLSRYDPSYPLVPEVENQIAKTRTAINAAEQNPVQEIATDRPPAQDWIATELARAEADRATQEARAAASAQVLRHYQSAAEQLDTKGTEQDDLIRSVKASEESYLLYLRKREEARISDALDTKRIVNVSIAEAATVPALPTLHLAWLFAGAFFTAGLLSLGTAYTVDRFDPSFRNPDELACYLDVTVLASIPENVGGGAE